MSGAMTPTALIRSLIGAAIGGAIGYFLFGWVLKQGFYAMILPGAALGFGAAKLAPIESATQGTICAVLATALGLLTEWRHFPFVKDDSLPYFLTHIHDLRPMTLIMIVAGTYFGYHFGKGREIVRSSQEHNVPGGSV